MGNYQTGNLWARRRHPYHSKTEQVARLAQRRRLRRAAIVTHRESDVIGRAPRITRAWPDPVLECKHANQAKTLIWNDCVRRSGHKDRTWQSGAGVASGPPP